jgi:hypothetical protein
MATLGTLSGISIGRIAAFDEARVLVDSKLSEFTKLIERAQKPLRQEDIRRLLKGAVTSLCGLRQELNSKIGEV